MRPSAEDPSSPGGSPRRGGSDALPIHVPRTFHAGLPRSVPARQSPAVPGRRGHTRAVGRGPPTCAHRRTAGGDQRRPAFRLTRSLLGGARSAGYSAALLAKCLGSSITSVRNRDGSNGWIAGDVFAALTDLPPRAVDGWFADGALTQRVVGHTGRPCFPADELIRALGGVQAAGGRPPHRKNRSTAVGRSPGEIRGAVPLPQGQRNRTIQDQSPSRRAF